MQHTKRGCGLEIGALSTAAKRASPHEKRNIEFYKEKVAGLKIDKPNAKHCDLVKEVAVMWKETQEGGRSGDTGSRVEGDSAADAGVVEAGFAA